MKKENETTKKIILILTNLMVLFLTYFIRKMAKNNINSFISAFFKNNQLGEINA